MPARRNFLPRPCPECNLDYGSLRIGVFKGRIGCSILVRIKHYNPVGYGKVKKEIEGNTISKNKKEQRLEIMKAQQKWCSVRINKEFAFKFEPVIKWYYSQIERRHDHNHKIINWEFKPRESFVNAVKKYGWHDLPKYSQIYRRQKDVEEIRSHIKKNPNFS